MRRDGARASRAAGALVLLVALAACDRANEPRSPAPVPVVPQDTPSHPVKAIYEDPAFLAGLDEKTREIVEYQSLVDRVHRHGGQYHDERTGELVVVEVDGERTTKMEFSGRGQLRRYSEFERGESQRFTDRNLDGVWDHFTATREGESLEFEIELSDPDDDGYFDRQEIVETDWNRRWSTVVRTSYSRNAATGGWIESRERIESDLSKPMY